MESPLIRIHRWLPLGGVFRPVGAPNVHHANAMQCNATPSFNVLYINSKCIVLARPGK